MFFVTGPKTIYKSGYLSPYTISIEGYLALPIATRKQIQKKELIIPIGFSQAGSFDYYGSYLPSKFPGVLAFSRPQSQMPKGPRFLEKITIPTKKGGIVTQDCILPPLLASGSDTFLPAGSKVPSSNYGKAIEYFPHDITASLSFVNAAGVFAAWYNTKLYSPSTIPAKGDLRSSKNGWKYYVDTYGGGTYPVKSEVVAELKNHNINQACGSATILLNSKTQEWRIASVSGIKDVSDSIAYHLAKDSFLLAAYNEFKDPFQNAGKVSLTSIEELLEGVGGSEAEFTSIDDVEEVTEEGDF